MTHQVRQPAAPITTAIAALCILLAACGSEPPAPDSGSEPVVASPSNAGEPSASQAASPASEPPTPSNATGAPVVVSMPSGILPPGSVARVTADGLRVRMDRPQGVEHETVVSTLNAGDIVLIEQTPFAYIGPESSPDGRGWYQVHVGGTSITSHIDGGINGWVAEGEDALEFLEPVEISCPETLDLAALLAPPGQGVDGDLLTPDWDRLACAGGESLELVGVFEYLCNEGGIYPFAFEPPYLASPRSCTGLIADEIDAQGYGRAGSLELRIADFTAALPERGDVLQVTGRFDDPAAADCTATTEPGFTGPGIDPEFLVLFCRERFVLDAWTVTDHRDLAPLPWEVTP